MTPQGEAAEIERSEDPVNVPEPHWPASEISQLVIGHPAVSVFAKNVSHDPDGRTNNPAPEAL